MTTGFTHFTSRGFALPQTNIDTDQIIPARFLSTTEKGGLAKACFADWRFDGDGKPSAHPLNTVDLSTHSVLVGGQNFGSGSSREHAVWALKDFGVRAVVTSQAADIFKSNASKNALVVAEIDEEHHQALLADPDQAMTIDIESQELRYGDHVASFKLEPFARLCMIQGVDQMGYLLGQDAQISAFEAARA